jgi:hypothetical protein
VLPKATPTCLATTITDGAKGEMYGVVVAGRVTICPLALSQANTNSIESFALKDKI